MNKTHVSIEVSLIVTAFSQRWKDNRWTFVFFFLPFEMTEMIQSLIENINTAKRLSTGHDFK